MTSTSNRIAVDTCVLMNVLTSGGADDPSWLARSLSVLEHAQGPDTQLVVPAIVLPELAGNGNIRGRHLNPKDRKERIGKVRDWMRGFGYVLVDVDSIVARIASDLAIERDLKGPDACVLACALHANASTLYTWDKKLIDQNGINGMIIREPEDRGRAQSLFEA